MRKISVTISSLVGPKSMSRSWRSLMPQHLLAVVVVAPALPPEIGRLDGRHQDLDGAGAVLLLAHDLLDLGQHPAAERQPGIDARRLLADHARPQHQSVRDDLRLLRRFAKNWQEVAGQAHDCIRSGSNGGAVNRHACEKTSPFASRPLLTGFATDSRRTNSMLTEPRNHLARRMAIRAKILSRPRTKW